PSPPAPPRAAAPPSEQPHTSNRCTGACTGRAPRPPPHSRGIWRAPSGQVWLLRRPCAARCEPPENPPRSNEKRRVPGVHGAREWRWRESNPRPTVLPQDFSGCSLLADLLGPSDHADKSLTGPVTLKLQTAQ